LAIRSCAISIASGGIRWGEARSIKMMLVGAERFIVRFGHINNPFDVEATDPFETALLLAGRSVIFRQLS
jgi:hypothetical protein